MVSNYAKVTTLFAIIYCLILVVSGGLAALKSASPASAHAPVPTATQSGSSSTLAVLLAELLAISLLVIAEMRFGLLTKSYGFIKRYLHGWSMPVFSAAAFAAESLAVLYYGGLGWFEFAFINIGGIYIIWAIFLRKDKLLQDMPIYITFLLFFILWPYCVSILRGSGALPLAFLLFAYLPATFLFSVLLMRRPTQFRMNAVAFSFAIMLPPFIGTLFIPIYAVILLGIFSVYDFLAVFVTKHMQYMAKKLLSVNMPEAFIIGDLELARARIRAIGTDNDPKQKDAQKTQIQARNAIPDSERPVIIGVGDAVLPGIVISSFMLGGMPTYAILATIGCIAGVLLNLFVLKRIKRVLPALPLIFVSILALLGAVVI